MYEVVRDNLETLYGAIGDGAIADPANVARYLAAVGEATEVPPRSLGGRGPPYWKSCVLRRQALGEEDDGQGP